MTKRQLPCGEIAHACPRWDPEARGGDIMETVGRVMSSQGHSPLLREPIVLTTWGLAYQALLASHLVRTHAHGVSETALRMRTSDRRIERLLRLVDEAVPPEFAGLAVRPTERAVLPVVLSVLPPARGTVTGEALIAERLEAVPDRPYPGVARDILAAHPDEFAHLGEYGLRGLLYRIDGRPVDHELTPADVSTPEFESRWRKGQIAGIDGAVFRVLTGRLTLIKGEWSEEVIHVPVMLVAGGYPEVPIAVSVGEEAGRRAESLVHAAVQAGLRAPVTMMFDGHAAYRTHAFRVACGKLGFRPQAVKLPAENPAERVIRHLKESVPHDVMLSEFVDCLVQAVAFSQAMGNRAA
ncbi:MAG: hypothetical protein ACYDC5_04780 [Candidatus Dormibacteria bacterium]